MVMVGEKAPEWTATAYVRGEKKTISSKDYVGKWHVLYWYPLDFTFVCPTEIRGFQGISDEFAAEGVEIIGASTDSFYSHKAWFEDGQTFSEKITHPVIADTSHRFTNSFGVMKPEAGTAFRATVIVDDKGVIRSLSVHDTSVGRSPGETLRMVQALKSGGLCPVDWKKGEKFVGG
jgi:peroxiredoxin (alkyl hydroperoxide reductase subunit C)